MKVTYSELDHNEITHVKRQCVYKFKIASSILKKHYKALARMSMLFNDKERNVGFIKNKNKEAFLKLIEEIEKSNDKRCATSHKKAVENAKSKYSKASSSRCEHEDLGSLGYAHGEIVTCPHCGQRARVW